MKKFDFRVTLSGEGADPDDAWLDAIDAFASAPGPIPIDYDICLDDEDVLDWKCELEPDETSNSWYSYDNE